MFQLSLSWISGKFNLQILSLEEQRHSTARNWIRFIIQVHPNLCRYLRACFYPPSSSGKTSCAALQILDFWKGQSHQNQAIDKLVGDENKFAAMTVSRCRSTQSGPCRKWWQHRWALKRWRKCSSINLHKMFSSLDEACIPTDYIEGDVCRQPQTNVRTKSKPVQTRLCTRITFPGDAAPRWSTESREQDGANITEGDMCSVDSPCKFSSNCPSWSLAVLNHISASFFHPFLFPFRPIWNHNVPFIPQCWVGQVKAQGDKTRALSLRQNKEKKTGKVRKKSQRISCPRKEAQKGSFFGFLLFDHPRLQIHRCVCRWDHPSV